MRTISPICKWTMAGVLLLVSFAVKSQENRVIFIMADRQQPFYVRTANKVYSSSTLGYAIMPQLKQEKFSLTIGFPKNKWRTTKYNIELGENDLFLILKQVDSTTWGLYDKHTKLVFIPDEIAPQMKPDISKDPFSVILAEVSDNPSILQQKNKETLIVVEHKKEVEPTRTRMDDNKDSTNTVQNHTDIVSADAQSKPSGVQTNKTQKIQRTAYQIDSSGLTIGYEWDEGNGKEMITLLIPVDPEKPQPDAELIATDEKRKKQNEVERGDVPGNGVNVENKENVEQRVKDNRSSTCKKLASEQDFKSFRKSLASEEDEENMIKVAESILADSSRCYTVEQIKNLAVLYLNDRLRFQFIENAIKHLSDPEQLNLLDSLIPNEENRKRIRSFTEKKQD